MIRVRKAERKDCVHIYELIKELALYEKAQDQVTNTVVQLEIDLFDNPICSAIVAEDKDEILGFALYYTSYSTWKGRCLYLEDFYVKEVHRKKGIGKLLFDEVVHIAKLQKVKRMDWQVLEWNEPGLEFYRKEKAILDGEWVNGRLFFE